MVKLINWLTGTDMYVAEDRVEEYLKAGHKMPCNKVQVEKPVKAEKKTPKKRKSEVFSWLMQQLQTFRQE